MEKLEEAIVCVGSKWQLSSAEQWLHPWCPSLPDKVALGTWHLGLRSHQAADPVSHCVPDVAACPRRECGSSLPTSASLTTWCGCYVWQKAESRCWVPRNLTRFAFREDGLRRCLYWTDVCVYIYIFIYFSNIYFFFSKKDIKWVMSILYSVPLSHSGCVRGETEAPCRGSLLLGVCAASSLNSVLICSHNCSTNNVC